MTLEILQKEMIAALKAGEKTRKQVIAGMVDAVKKAGIDEKCRDNIPETLVNKVLTKCKKVANEQLETCPDDRKELKNFYIEQLSIIEEFAPQLIVDLESIEFMIKDLGIELTKNNRGNIMKAFKQTYDISTVDMSIVNKVLGVILA